MEIPWRMIFCAVAQPAEFLLCHVCIRPKPGSKCLHAMEPLYNSSIHVFVIFLTKKKISITKRQPISSLSLVLRICKNQPKWEKSLLYVTQWLSRMTKLSEILCFSIKCFLHGLVTFGYAVSFQVGCSLQAECVVLISSSPAINAGLQTGDGQKRMPGQTLIFNKVQS